MLQRTQKEEYAKKKRRKSGPTILSKRPPRRDYKATGEEGREENPNRSAISVFASSPPMATSHSVDFCGLPNSAFRPKRKKNNVVFYHKKWGKVAEDRTNVNDVQIEYIKMKAQISLLFYGEIR